MLRAHAGSCVLRADVRRTWCAYRGVGTASGASIALEYVAGYPATINHKPSCVEAVQTAVVNALGVLGARGRALSLRRVCVTAVPGRGALVTPDITMGAEDFSRFLDVRPGAFFFVGSAPDGCVRAWGPPPPYSGWHGAQHTEVHHHRAARDASRARRQADPRSWPTTARTSQSTRPRSSAAWPCSWSSWSAGWRWRLREQCWHEAAANWSVGVGGTSCASPVVSFHNRKIAHHPAITAYTLIRLTSCCMKKKTRVAACVAREEAGTRVGVDQQAPAVCSL